MSQKIVKFLYSFDQLASGFDSLPKPASSPIIMDLDTLNEE